MIRIILILFLVWVSTAQAKENDCKWDNNIPCLTIYPKYTNNSNALGDKVSPTIIIRKDEIEKYNLIDLPKVLSYIQGIDVTQSGPTGQQGSVFFRGTNSNHTLVLLNGIPINDYSTPTGAHDIGQDFMFNVIQIEVYKGSAGAHFGADAVGGAINFKTTVDYSKKLNVSGNGNDKTINGNYFTSLDGYDISITAGQHKSKNVSALSGANEKDGTDNKSVAVNVSKWYNLINWRTSWFARNTFTDIDGHNVSIQDGKWADNTFYALQTGLEYKNSSLTFHTHEYDRDYDDSHYESENHTIRGTQQYEKFGFGFDYKHNESLTNQHHNLGYFFNLSHNIFTYHHRFDEEHETYKLGFFKEIDNGLSISGSTSTSYKDKTTWTAIEYGESQELTLTKNNFATTIFKNDIGDLNTDGIEFSYGQKDFKIFASHLNSKKKDTVQLRRPNWSFGFMHIKDLVNNFSLTTNYKYKGKHLDVHNSNWSTISMPETHLLDVGITKNYYNYHIGINVSNMLGESYEAPHGFNQNGRSINFVFKKTF
jgi:outer membrane cobalamin receptor